MEPMALVQLFINKLLFDLIYKFLYNISMEDNLITKVKLTESVDVKDMRALMEKHSIIVLKEETVDGDSIFTLKASEDRLEDILMSTNLYWDFYWK
jgi:hypothetical protein